MQLADTNDLLIEIEDAPNVTAPKGSAYQHSAHHTTLPVIFGPQETTHASRFASEEPKQVSSAHSPSEAAHAFDCSAQASLQGSMDHQQEIEAAPVPAPLAADLRQSLPASVLQEEETGASAAPASAEGPLRTAAKAGAQLSARAAAVSPNMSSLGGAPPACPLALSGPAARASCLDGEAGGVGEADSPAEEQLDIARMLAAVQVPAFVSAQHADAASANVSDACEVSSPSGRLAVPAVQGLAPGLPTVLEGMAATLPAVPPAVASARVSAAGLALSFPRGFPSDDSLSSHDPGSSGQQPMETLSNIMDGGTLSSSSSGERRGNSSSRRRQSPRGPLTPVPSAFAKASLDSWDVANAKAAAAAAARVAHALNSRAALKGASAFQELSYSEALDHFAIVLDLSHLHKEVEATLPAARGFLSHLLCMSRPPPVGLRSQVVQLLSLGQVAFCDDDECHLQLLRSVFCAYTGASVPPARLGPHWALLGFQGSDPATTLTPAGILGLLQLYCLQHHHADNAAKVYRLSGHSVQHFPLATVSLNVTTWVLQLARQGSLTALAKRYNSVFEAANIVHIGAMYTFYNRWLKGGKTMADSSAVLQALNTHVMKNPVKMAHAANLSLADRP